MRGIAYAAVTSTVEPSGMMGLARVIFDIVCLVVLTGTYVQCWMFMKEVVPLYMVDALDMTEANE